MKDMTGKMLFLSDVDCQVCGERKFPPFISINSKDGNHLIICKECLMSLAVLLAANEGV